MKACVRHTSPQDILWDKQKRLHIQHVVRELSGFLGCYSYFILKLLRKYAEYWLDFMLRFSRKLFPIYFLPTYLQEVRMYNCEIERMILKNRQLKKMLSDEQNVTCLSECDEVVLSCSSPNLTSSNPSVSSSRMWWILGVEYNTVWWWWWNIVQNNLC